jgi:FKBP-type peptidyl-prolyl cis-trans isomerase
LPAETEPIRAPDYAGLLVLISQRQAKRFQEGYRGFNIFDFQTAWSGKTIEGMMRLKIIGASLAVSSLLLSACTKEKKELETLKEKASYTIGQQMGGSLAQVATEIDEASLVQGLKDVLAKKPPLIEPQAGMDALKEYQGVLQKVMTERQAAESVQTLKAANDFLAENLKKAGVKSTASGLQYEVLTEGTGVIPKDTDTVKVHYRGTLLDGTEFDSSYKRGEPISFPLNGVIPGWSEGLQLMKTGSKYKLYLPPALAYGDRGAGDQIRPNSALIFEVELLEIVKQ